MKKKLSHVGRGNRAAMVDVGGKPDSARTACATGSIRLARETMRLIGANKIRKGNVLCVAELAGIQAAKQTSALIPLCHIVPLAHVEVRATLGRQGATVTGTVKSIGKTGVEMEALTAVATALLSIYDMCKAVDKTMVIGNIRLVSKTKEATG